MGKLYLSWCKYCGEGLDKKPYYKGNSCFGCKTKRARLYSAKYDKKNAKAKRTSRGNSKRLSTDKR